MLLEMKKGGEPLDRHYEQAFDYWLNLTPAKPEYVVLCNFDEFWIYDLHHQLDAPVDRIAIEDLPRRWEAMGFMLPNPVQPVFANDLVSVTRNAAATVAHVANSMIDRGVERSVAQRFTMQSVVAMFAEDIGLLPTHLFTKALDDATGPSSAYDLLFGLFAEMNRPGVTPAGRFEGTPYFNGSLFSTVDPVDLTTEEVVALHHAASHDWSAVRPEIFGTLFEQSLGVDDRRAYGAHFTSGADIQRIVRPTIVNPWRERISKVSTLQQLGQIETELLAFRVLDPACGCGNFLYVAYREMRKLEALIEERRQEISTAQRAVTARLSLVNPRMFYGIDIDPFAVEIAKVTLLLAKQLAAIELHDFENPLPLDDLSTNIVTGDALFVDWPAADVIVGNPPYLGRRQLVEHRGAEYATRLTAEHPNVSGVSDYVVYWFQLAQDRLPEHGRAGLVGTNSIRHGDSRRNSLDYIIDRGGEITDAYSSLEWSGDANVSVSIVNWTKGKFGDKPILRIGDADNLRNVEPVKIYGHLDDSLNVAGAQDLASNREPKLLHQGQTVGHTDGFVLRPGTSRQLRNTQGGADVIHPYMDGHEMLRERHPVRSVIDFDQDDVVLARAAAPHVFAYVEERVLPDRRARAEGESTANAAALAANPKARVNWHHRGFYNRWWQHSYRRADFLAAVDGLDRYIGVSRVASEERLPVFTFIDSSIRPSDAMQCLSADDDYTFGIVQSSLHAAWLRARCSTLESRFRYTTKTIWHSYPWPQDPSDSKIDAVVDAASRLLKLREERLEIDISLVQQYDSLRLPGQNSLRIAHQRLDDAVRDAYGFSAGDPLQQLLDLNLELARRESAGEPVRGPGADWIDAGRRKRTEYRITPGPDFLSSTP
jgi:hypothetical protein